MPVINSAASLPDNLLNDLLDAASDEEVVSRLTAVGLLHEGGLNQLLGEIGNMIRSEPAKARRLAAVCAAAAAPANAPAVVPRAAYLRAQTYAMDSEFQAALQLIEEAHAGYAALQMELPALRTNVGKMHVLVQLGQYQEALAAGDVALNRIQNAPPDDSIWNDPEARLVIMLTHMNQGICYRRMGQYEQALIVYNAAEQECLRHNLTNHLGDIRNNAGVTLMYLGRVTEALVAFESAASAYLNANHTRLYAYCLNNIGEAHLLLGNYRASLEALQTGRQQFEQLQTPVDEYLLLLEGHVYLALNLYPESLAAYKEAELRCQTAGMSHYQARALWGMGAAYVGQAQFEQAALALEKAADLFAAADNAPFHASVLLEQAALRLAQGDRKGAQQVAQEAADLLAGKSYPVEQLYVHLRLADLAAPDLAVVEDYLLTAEELSKQLPLPHLRYRVQQRLGQLRRQQGQMGAAREHLQAAIADIEQLRGSVAQEAMRVSFLYDKIAAYEELLLLYLETNEVYNAFATTEQAKSRALVDLLIGMDQPAAPLLDSQANRLQQLQADLNAVYSEFLGSKSSQELTASAPELHARAQELEREINRLRLQTAVSRPGDPFAASLPPEKISHYLPEDAILLAYHLIGDEIMAFVHYAGETRVARHIGQSESVQRLIQRLTMQWDRFRAGDTFVQRHINQLEESAKRILHSLYRTLIAPVIDLFPPSLDNGRPRRLAIIPHGLLHQAPFHALYDGEQYLLERFEISYAPSITTMALCQQRQARLSSRAVIAGIADELIPAVETELQAVAEQAQRRWPETAVYYNETATRQTIQRESGAAGLLHLACHGLFRADNPMFSALKLHDNWLTAVDVLQFDLNGALVALSACESGRSQVTYGDELLGLTRAFLGAGANSLLVSLWLAQDETTARLMGDWYAQLAQERPAPRAAALRAAQLKLKAQYAHPYYWAPFILIGKN
jgi:CHAT domain-containing protein